MSRQPPEIAKDFRHAIRLEWWTLVWMSTVIAAMWLTMGGSKAMQSALIEDVLSLVPALTFLLAARFENREPTAKFPFGFYRVNSLAFLVSAVALGLVGAFLIYESATTLLAQEHPTLAPVEMFGYQLWSGWPMIAALVYSIVPPVIIGRMKEPVAKRLHDKVLHTDALMQKADWQTGVAGILGITGIYFGYWWADSAAALFIAASVMKDALTNIRIASAELLDGAPRALDRADIAADAQRLHARLSARWPEGEVRLRESGRYIVAAVDGVGPDSAEVPPLETLMGEDDGWRLSRLGLAPRQAAADE